MEDMHPRINNLNQSIPTIFSYSHTHSLSIIITLKVLITKINFNLRVALLLEPIDLNLKNCFKNPVALSK